MIDVDIEKVFNDDGELVGVYADDGPIFHVLGAIEDDGITVNSLVDQEKTVGWSSSPEKTWTVTVGPGTPAKTPSYNMTLPSTVPDEDDEPCHHCGRAWHKARLTKQMWNMFQSNKFDPNYLSSEDRSPVLCEGSLFIGPMQDEDVQQKKWGHATGTIVLPASLNPFVEIASTVQKAQGHFEKFIKAFNALNADLSWNAKTWLPKDPFVHILGEPSSYSLYDESWNLIHKAPWPMCLVDITIEFGPRNWWCEFWAPLWKAMTDWVWHVGGPPWKLHYPPTLVLAVEKTWSVAAQQVTLPPAPEKPDWQKMFPKENQYGPTTKGFTS